MKGVKPRPARVQGTTAVITTPVGSVFVTINEDEHDEPMEVFLTVGKAGSDITADAEAIGRLLSFALRVEAVLSPRERLYRIAKQLEGIGGSRSTGLGMERVRSLADGVAQVLLSYLGNAEKHPRPAAVGRHHTEAKPAASPAVKPDLCPSCGNATLVLEEGCQKCHSCGHSEC